MTELDRKINGISKDIIEKYSSSGKKISSAESCTGGLVASSLVSIVGASKVFLGSVVSYSDSAKAEILSVSQTTLAKYSAVSPQCAEEMAIGALNVYKSDVSVSTTGYIDGNLPSSAERSLAGRVFFATAVKRDSKVGIEESSIMLRSDAPRDINRRLATYHALTLLLKSLAKFE